MQGRSIGSKRFSVGDRAPQREENTPHDWTAHHELNAQLTVPRRPAQLHPLALRHGLIASQLGLPMQTQGQPQPAAKSGRKSERYATTHAHAAYRGEADYAAYDQSFNEQTENYDEWELQKELVTYRETYPSHDPSYVDHPPLDIQLPPVAAEYDDGQRHELDYAQASYAPGYREPQSPGSYHYAQNAQPAAARWHSEQPIRRVAPGQARPSAAPAAQTARVAVRGGTAQAPAPRSSVQARSTGAQSRPPQQNRAAKPRESTQTGFVAQPHAAHARATSAGYAAQPSAATKAGLTAHSRAEQPRVATSAGYAAQPSAAQARATSAGQHYGRSAGSGGTTRAPVQSVRRAPVRRFVDDRPVVYPHKRSWLKRMLMLLVLAGGGYAAYHYHYLDRLFERAPVAPPAPPAPPALPDPPPTAAAVATPEPPPAIAEPAALEPVQAQPTPELSAKEQRRAARAAIIAERWRERRAARRGRDSDSSDERDTSTSSSKSPSYASAQDDYVSQQHAAAQSGVLRINSLPWSQIHVDGELVGHTPQMNLLLPAGKHRVTLVNNEMQLSKSLTVLITAGNITTHTINLAE